MSTNLIISALVIIIAILVGILIITNYNWFSQEWLIGLGIIMASMARGWHLGIFQDKKMISSHYFTINTGIFDVWSMWFATLPKYGSSDEPAPFEPITIRS